METVRASVAAQSAALSPGGRRDPGAAPAVEQRRFVPLSSAEAVIRYWQRFHSKSWAGAISIDLLPVVLVLVLMIVNDAMRQGFAESARRGREHHRGRNAAGHGALSPDGGSGGHCRPRSSQSQPVVKPEPQTEVSPETVPQRETEAGDGIGHPDRRGAAPA
jgi:hypothetical protein